MIQEVWTMEVGSESYNPVSDWLRRLAQAAKKHDKVIDAYGLRSETGDAEFRRMYLVLVFESIEVRNECYKTGLIDLVRPVIDENADQQYAKQPWPAHYYYNVLN